MNDNDIIKAVGCCETKDCHDCPYKLYTNCREAVMRDARDLITRQKSKIEKLKRYDEERDIRLHARLTETARAEAIREFAERLKRRHLRLRPCFGVVRCCLSENDIDNLVKEMTEVHHAKTD